MIFWLWYYNQSTSHSQPIHCKNIWVTTTIFWSSQLHACGLYGILQNFKRMLVVEKLLSQLGSSNRKSIAIWLHSWHFYHKYANKRNKALLQGQMFWIKETPTSPEMV